MRRVAATVSRLQARNPLLARTLANLVHLAGGNASAAVLNALVVAAIARMLGPTNLGVLAMIQAYGTLVDQIVRLETWQSLIRYGAQALEEQQAKRFLALVKLGILADFAGAFAAGAIALLFVPVAAHLLGWQPGNAAMARWYCLAVLAGISSTPVGILRLFNRFRQFAWLEPAIAGVRLTAIGLAFLLNGTMWDVLLILIAVQWLYRLALGALAWRELRRQGYGNPFNARLKDLEGTSIGYWRLAVATNAAALVRKSTQEFDVLIVGAIAGSSVVGIYDLARRITNLAIKAGTMIQQVALPDLSRLWARRDVAGFRLIVKQIELLTVAAGIAFVIFVALRGSWIVATFAGPRFASAATPLLVQSIAACLFLCGSAVRPALITMGEETRLLGIVVVAAGAFYLTLLLAVPSLGAVGASLAHVAFASTLLPLGGLALATSLRPHAPAGEAAFQDPRPQSHS